MEVRQVSSFAELDQCFEEFQRFQGWVYRGQADESWGLLQKLARAPIVREYSLSALNPLNVFEVPPFLYDFPGLAEELHRARDSAARIVERRSLSKWKQFSLPYLTKQPEYDWEWLAIGQHYGLMTRLLDWTENPLAAAFFALSENREAAAAIYALRCVRRLDVRTPLDSFKGLAIYTPLRTLDRVIRQDSHFSVSGNPCFELNGDGEAELVKFVIPADLREVLLRKIISFGVDRSTLFPDLDGAATHINWCLDHPGLLVQGDPNLDRSLTLVHEKFKALVASRLQNRPLPPNPTPAADGKAAAEG